MQIASKHPTEIRIRLRASARHRRHRHDSIRNSLRSALRASVTWAACDDKNSRQKFLIFIGLRQWKYDVSGSVHIR